jgi:hypothetical protein
MASGGPLPDELAHPWWDQRWTLGEHDFSVLSSCSDGRMNHIRGTYEHMGHVLLLTVVERHGEPSPVEPGRRHYVRFPSVDELILSTPAAAVRSFTALRDDLVTSLRRA